MFTNLSGESFYTMSSSVDEADASAGGKEAPATVVASMLLEMTMMR